MFLCKISMSFVGLIVAFWQSWCCFIKQILFFSFGLTCYTNLYLKIPLKSLMFLVISKAFLCYINFFIILEGIFIWREEKLFLYSERFAKTQAREWKTVKRLCEIVIKKSYWGFFVCLFANFIKMYSQFNLIFWWAISFLIKGRKN